jgi:hypothetical protein
MNNVAFVTYNSIGRNLPSGWHERGDRRALLVQGSENGGWAVDQFYNADPESYDRSEHVDHVRGTISNLWGTLQKALAELDHVVIYVGSHGSEQAIELASELPASKVSFIGCDCGLPIKEAMIQAAGLADAGRFLCECGGRRTMKALFELFMDTGVLLTVEPA